MCKQLDSDPLVICNYQCLTENNNNNNNSVELNFFIRVFANSKDPLIGKTLINIYIKQNNSINNGRK
jgi:hypothetical protein